MVRTWLITGSSRGLGRALAEAVLNAGDNLVATARNTSGLEDLADRYPAQVILWPLDVTNYLAAEAAVNAAVEQFGRLNVVANVASYGNLGPIEDTSIEDFHAQIDTNLFGLSVEGCHPDHARPGLGPYPQFLVSRRADRLNRPSALFSREVRSRRIYLSLRNLSRSEAVPFLFRTRSCGRRDVDLLQSRLSALLGWAHLAAHVES